MFNQCEHPCLLTLPPLSIPQMCVPQDASFILCLFSLHILSHKLIPPMPLGIFSILMTSKTTNPGPGLALPGCPSRKQAGYTQNWTHPSSENMLPFHIPDLLIAQLSTHSPDPEISSFPFYLSLTLHFQLVNEFFPLHLRSLSHHPQSHHAKSSSFLLWNFKISELVGWPHLDLSSTFPPESIFIFLHN